MEFLYNCEKLLGCDAEGFTMIDGRKGMNQPSMSAAAHTLRSTGAHSRGFSSVLNESQN